MSVLPDPITDLLGLWLKRSLDSRLARYCTLVLEMGIAAAIASAVACGSALMAQASVSWAIGAGLVAMGVALLATFQASPNSKGLVISLQQLASKTEIETGTTTIARK